MKKYYKVEFSGAIYIEAENEDDALAKIDDDEDHPDIVLKEWEIGDSASEVSEDEIEMKVNLTDWR